MSEPELDLAAAAAVAVEAVEAAGVLIRRGVRAGVSARRKGPHADVVTQLDLVPLKAQKRDVNIAMSNSFGFGGTNAALILSKI